MEITKSESINELATALAKAQGEIKGAKKDAVNPYFKAHYSDLSSTWEACREPLSKYGLSIIQLANTLEDGTPAVDTILAHSSGQYICSRLAVRPVKDDPQGVGSVLTYIRRYSLAAIVGVAPEDDDAEAAVNRTKEATPPVTNIPPASHARKSTKPTYITDEQISEIYDLAGKSKYTNEDIKKYMTDTYKINAIKLMPQEHVNEFKAWLIEGQTKGV